jgi:hypothetical protein
LIKKEVGWQIKAISVETVMINPTKSSITVYGAIGNCLNQAVLMTATRSFPHAQQVWARVKLKIKQQRLSDYLLQWHRRDACTSKTWSEEGQYVEDRADEELSVTLW